MADDDPHRYVVETVDYELPVHEASLGEDGILFVRQSPGGVLGRLSPHYWRSVWQLEDWE